MQYDERNKLQPIAFASRTLNQAESNYSTTNLEVFAVVRALRHFRDIIYGYEIRVRTDHTAIVELFNTKSLTGKLAKWSLLVHDFNPSFDHFPGAVNNVADVLSRYIGVIEDTDIDQYEEASRCHNVILKYSIRNAQRADTFCQPIIYYLESGNPNALPRPPVPVPEFDLNEGLLVRHTCITTKDGSNRDVTQLIIPEILVTTILQRIHSSPHAVHPGKKRTLLQARMLYYWSKMRLDIIKYIDNSCIQQLR